MDHPPPSTQAEVEAMVRAYLARVARRYLPLLAGVVGLLLIVILVPTATAPTGGQQLGFGTTGSSTTGATATGAGGGGAAGNAVGGTVGGSGGAAPVGAGAGSGPAGAGSPPAAGGGSRRGGSAPGAATTVGGPVAASHDGVARSGVHCGPGKKQVPWSAYAPPCVKRFTGDNGGATSRGVTASTITMSYRVTTSADDAAISAATGSAAPPKDSDYIADLDTYISYFNTQFELYGRKVVVKPFNGQGDYIQEDQGQGGAQAQADAASAHSEQAFGDVTYDLRGSNLYWSALAQQGIVAWGPLGFPTSYYQRHAPYWWSYTPSGSAVADWFANLTCRRLAGLDAVFSPDVTYQHHLRVFGLVHPNNPEYVAVAGELKAKLKSCGVAVAREADYSINVAQYQTEATNVMAQMRSKGVTTVLCYCDPVVPIFLENAAQSQRYNPEWVQPYWGDPQARQPDNGNWGGVISQALQWPAEKDNEAYRVYLMASGGKAPHEKYYAAVYAALMQVYMGLQAAGPDLTPQTLQRGYASLPDTKAGLDGAWSFQGAHLWTPQVSGGMGYYDPNYRSNFDGALGGYRACDGGKIFTFADASTWGGPRQQMHCFGR